MVSIEEKEVFKETLLSYLDELVKKIPPRAPNGEHYIRVLRNKIVYDDTIQVSEIIKKLAHAGYTVDEIFNFLLKAQIIESAKDMTELKYSIRKIIYIEEGE